MNHPLAKVWGMIMATVTFSFAELESALRLLALAIGIGYSIWTWRRAYVHGQQEDKENNERQHPH